MGAVTDCLVPRSDTSRMLGFDANGGFLAHDRGRLRGKSIRNLIFRSPLLFGALLIGMPSPRTSLTESGPTTCMVSTVKQ